MEKMSKRTTRDYISDLPDSLLVEILSFLNMKEVVRTCILSTRWRYIWTSVPTLTFKYIATGEQRITKFVGWVNRTLLLCRATNIKKFKVKFAYIPYYASDVDVWCRFVAEKKIESMSLRLVDGNTYSLSQTLCDNSSLIDLSISGCSLPSSLRFGWTSLRRLSMTEVIFSKDTMAKMLSGSPMLEYLKIGQCYFIEGLYINSKSLRELVIYCPPNLPVEISASNVQSFHILGHLSGQFRLSFPSLHRIVFDVYGNAKKRSYFIEILESMQHVVELELGRNCVKVFSLPDANSLSLSPLPSLKCLKLKGFIDKQVVASIINLLKCSPNLEQLVVNKICESLPMYRSSSVRKVAEKKWKSIRTEKFPLPHLKTVKFHGYKEVEDVNESTYVLVHSILANAEHLGSIVISVGDHPMLIMPRAA